jgi:hypothetical protein
MRKLTEADLAGHKAATEGYAKHADEYRALLSQR